MNAKITRDQTGLVSIMVSIIMILIVSLIVLGFAQVARHNQREALDRQLSAQAYYAAETGVNDAANFLTANINYSSTSADQTQCNHITSAAGWVTSNLLDNTNPVNSHVKYTCLLVNTHPPRLQQSPLTTSNSGVVWRLTDANGRKITKLKFTWKNSQAAANRGLGMVGACPGVDVLPQASSWNCSFGILRLDLTEASATAVSQTALENNTQTGTVYIFPKNTGGSVSFNPGRANNRGLVHGASCVGNACSLTLNLPGSASSYYARLTMLYEDSDSVSVTGTTTGGPLSFIGSQAMIDSTGQSQDELRRIQVMIPLTGNAINGSIPQNALESTSGVCKYFTVVPNSSATYQDPGTPACNYNE